MFFGLTIKIDECGWELLLVDLFVRHYSSAKFSSTLRYAV